MRHQPPDPGPRFSWESIGTGGVSDSEHVPSLSLEMQPGSHDGTPQQQLPPQQQHRPLRPQQQVATSDLEVWCRYQQTDTVKYDSTSERRRAGTPPMKTGVASRLSALAHPHTTCSPLAEQAKQAEQRSPLKKLCSVLLKICHSCGAPAPPAPTVPSPLHSAPRSACFPAVPASGRARGPSFYQAARAAAQPVLLFGATPGCLPPGMARSTWQLSDYPTRHWFHRGRHCCLFWAQCSYSGVPVVLKIYDLRELDVTCSRRVLREARLQLEHSQVAKEAITQLFAAFREGPLVVLVLECAGVCRCLHSKDFGLYNRLDHPYGHVSLQLRCPQILTLCPRYPVWWGGQGGGGGGALGVVPSTCLHCCLSVVCFLELKDPR